MTGEIPDWILSALVTGAAVFMFMLIYFWSIYLGRHPARAILEFRETRQNDQWQLEQARALLHGLDYVYHWPRGFEKCQGSDNKEHLGAGPYEDGHHGCYFCGVIAVPTVVSKEKSE